VVLPPFGWRIPVEQQRRPTCCPPRMYGNRVLGHVTSCPFWIDASLLPGPHKLFWLNRLRCYVRADRSLRQTLRAPNVVQHERIMRNYHLEFDMCRPIINANRLDDYWISDGLKASENHFRYGRSVSLLTETISVPPFVPENRVSISADFHAQRDLMEGLCPLQ